MYTQQQKDTAIKAYFKNQKNAAQTVRELGYPTVPALLNWIKASHLEPTSRYTSHNTIRLDVDGVVKKIMGTDYVKEELEGKPHTV